MINLLAVIGTMCIIYALYLVIKHAVAIYRAISTGKSGASYQIIRIGSMIQLTVHINAFQSFFLQLTKLQAQHLQNELKLAIEEMEEVS